MQICLSTYDPLLLPGIKGVILVRKKIRNANLFKKLLKIYYVDFFYQVSLPLIISQISKKRNLPIFKDVIKNKILDSNKPNNGNRRLLRLMF